MPNLDQKVNNAILSELSYTDLYQGISATETMNRLFNVSNEYKKSYGDGLKGFNKSEVMDFMGITFDSTDNKYKFLESVKQHIRKYSQ